MRPRDDESNKPNEAPWILSVVLDVKIVETLSCMAVTKQVRVRFNGSNTLTTMARCTETMAAVAVVRRDPFVMMDVSEVQYDISAPVQSKLDLVVPSNVPNSWPVTLIKLLPETGWATQLDKLFAIWSPGWILQFKLALELCFSRKPA